MQFNILSGKDILSLTNCRPGETKLGERIQTADSGPWQEVVAQSDARFVLVGIPEDIGVRANFGIGGANTAWQPALQALLNIQSTAKFQGSELLVLGQFDFEQVMTQSGGWSVEQLRVAVSEIDSAVAPVINTIVAVGKIPIIIGGGHNNCYPIIKGAAQAAGQSINAINLDAHSDFRMAEGRHSGNGFRYAKLENWLHRYSVIGLHESYNSQHVVEEFMSSPDLDFVWYEDIFIRESIRFDDAVSKAISFTTGRPVGLEIDLDCLSNVLASAMTPVGMSTLDARRYIRQCAALADVAYFHITEGATNLANGRTDMNTAKLIACFVTDFIKGVQLT